MHVCDPGNPDVRRFITSAFLTHREEGVRITALQAMVRVGRRGDAEAAASVSARLIDRSLAVRRVAARVSKVPKAHCRRRGER